MTQGVRNFLAYTLARASGRYAARAAWCELFLLADGAPALGPQHYHGIYIGLEKLKIVSVACWLRLLRLHVQRGAGRLRWLPGRHGEPPLQACVPAQLP